MIYQKMEQVSISKPTISPRQDALKPEPPKNLIADRYEVVQTLSGGMGAGSFVSGSC